MEALRRGEKLVVVDDYLREQAPQFKAQFEHYILPALCGATATEAVGFVPHLYGTNSTTRWLDAQRAFPGVPPRAL